MRMIKQQIVAVVTLQTFLLSTFSPFMATTAFAQSEKGKKNTQAKPTKPAAKKQQVGTPTDPTGDVIPAGSVPVASETCEPGQIRSEGHCINRSGGPVTGATIKGLLTDEQKADGTPLQPEQINAKIAQFRKLSEAFKSVCIDPDGTKKGYDPRIKGTLIAEIVYPPAVIDETTGKSVIPHFVNCVDEAKRLEEIRVDVESSIQFADQGAGVSPDVAACIKSSRFDDFDTHIGNIGAAVKETYDDDSCPRDRAGLKQSKSGNGDTLNSCMEDVKCNAIASATSPLRAIGLGALFNDPKSCGGRKGADCFGSIFEGIKQNLLFNVQMILPPWQGLPELGALAIKGIKVGAKKIWDNTPWGHKTGTVANNVSGRALAASHQPPSIWKQFRDDPKGFTKTLVDGIMRAIESSAIAAIGSDAPSLKCTTCNEKMNLVCLAVGFAGPGQWISSLLEGGLGSMVSIAGRAAGIDKVGLKIKEGFAKAMPGWKNGLKLFKKTEVAELAAKETSEGTKILRLAEKEKGLGKLLPAAARKLKAAKGEMAEFTAKNSWLKNLGKMAKEKGTGAATKTGSGIKKFAQVATAPVRHYLEFLEGARSIGVAGSQKIMGGIPLFSAIVKDRQAIAGIESAAKIGEMYENGSYSAKGGKLSPEYLKHEKVLTKANDVNEELITKLNRKAELAAAEKTPPATVEELAQMAAKGDYGTLLSTKDAELLNAARGRQVKFAETFKKTKSIKYVHSNAGFGEVAEKRLANARDGVRKIVDAKLEGELRDNAIVAIGRQYSKASERLTKELAAQQKVIEELGRWKLFKPADRKLVAVAEERSVQLRAQLDRVKKEYAAVVKARSSDDLLAAIGAEKKAPTIADTTPAFVPPPGPAAAQPSAVSKFLDKSANAKLAETHHANLAAALQDFTSNASKENLAAVQTHALEAAKANHKTSLELSQHAAELGRAGDVTGAAKAKAASEAFAARADFANELQRAKPNANILANTLNSERGLDTFGPLLRDPREQATAAEALVGKVATAQTAVNDAKIADEAAKAAREELAAATAELNKHAPGSVPNDALKAYTEAQAKATRTNFASYEAHDLVEQQNNALKAEANALGTKSLGNKLAANDAAIEKGSKDAFNNGQKLANDDELLKRKFGELKVDPAATPVDPTLADAPKAGDAVPDAFPGTPAKASLEDLKKAAKQQAVDAGIAERKAKADLKAYQEAEAKFAPRRNKAGKTVDAKGKFISPAAATVEQAEAYDAAFRAADQSAAKAVELGDAELKAKIDVFDELYSPGNELHPRRKNGDIVEPKNVPDYRRRKAEIAKLAKENDLRHEARDALRVKYEAEVKPYQGKPGYEALNTPHADPERNIARELKDGINSTEKTVTLKLCADGKTASCFTMRASEKLAASTPGEVASIEGLLEETDGSFRGLFKDKDEADKFKGFLIEEIKANPELTGDNVREMWKQAKDKCVTAP